MQEAWNRAGGFVFLTRLWEMLTLGAMESHLENCAEG